MQQSCNRATGLELLVYEALAYECFKSQAKHTTELQQSCNRATALMLLVYEVLSYECFRPQGKHATAATELQQSYICSVYVY